jgi:hypothetical protein
VGELLVGIENVLGIDEMLFHDIGIEPLEGVAHLILLLSRNAPDIS